MQRFNLKFNNSHLRVLKERERERGRKREMERESGRVGATSERCEMRCEKLSASLFKGNRFKIYKYSAQGVENNSLINNERKMRARVALTSQRGGRV